MVTLPPSTLPRVSRREFIDSWTWRQGEHVVIIGPTGSGKSTLQRLLMWQRDWAVVLCPKKRDDTYDAYLSEGFKRTERWPAPMPPKRQHSQHLLLWPKVRTMDDLPKFETEFRKCLRQIFEDEAWAVGLDDLYMLCKELGLAKEISTLNYQNRSIDVSQVGCMQRPAWVPRSTWDQASHAFIQNLADAEDIRTIRGLSRMSTRDLEITLRSLARYEWLYMPVADSSLEPVIIANR